MHEQQYTQCRLEKPTADGKLVETSWIPSQFAKVGKKLALRTVPTRPDCFSGMGEFPDESRASAWDNGWIVVEVGITKPSSWLNEHSRDWIRQRQASDI